MNILLTNDDGFNSLGIRKLKQCLSKYGRVVICAPKGAMSAKSVSITIGKPLEVIKEEDDVFSCSGTPADCVAFGLTSLSLEFDLVISGCNNGLNVSYDTVFSGTIGACIQAKICHKKAVAFSAPDGSDFEIVEKYFDQTWDFIFKNKLLDKCDIWNVNFPEGKKVNDIQLTYEYYREDKHFFTKCEDGYYAYRTIEQNFDSHPGSDCYAIKNGIVSVCCLGDTYFNHDFYKANITK